VTLEFVAGEVHCLLGENGAGKSTLCNTIFGVHPPDEGELRWQGKPYRPSGPAAALAAGIAMVHQHFSLVPDMTVLENLMLGQSRGLLDRHAFANRLEALAIAYDLALAPDALVGELSVGERQRVEIVKCLMRDPKLLLLDEPTAVLPPDEIGALLAVCRKVAAQGRGVVLVTHKLAEIAQVADRVSVLRGGRVVLSTAMADAEMGDLVRAMVGRELQSLGSALAATLGMGESPAARQATARAGAQRYALTIDGLTVRDRAGVTRLDGFSVLLRPGEIVGVAGVEGNGQSELGRVLAGLQVADSGSIFVGETELTGAGPRLITAAGVGIVPEDRHAVGCITGLSIAENLFLGRLDRFTRFGLLDRQRLNAAAAELMARFDVRAPGPQTLFGALSGGNQQKAVLARELTLEPLAVLVAAQPTRGLDVGAVEAIYTQIRDTCARGVSVLLISSELDELIAVSDRIVVIYRGRVLGEMPALPANRERIGALMSGHT
jgi:general nucleoside transport system ATP-binding protein